MKKKLIIIILFFFINFAAYGLEVTLTQGTVKPTPIAVTDFFAKDLSTQKTGKNVTKGQ